MSKKSLIWTVSVLALTALSIISTNMILDIKPNEGQKIDALLIKFKNDSMEQVNSIRSSAELLNNQILQARAVVSSVATQRTPTPGQNAFTQQFISGVVAADQRREQQLRPVEAQLGLISAQIVDLQNRATAIDIRIQDSLRDINQQMTSFFRDKDKSALSPETLIALIGIICTVGTLILGFRKDYRESRETELKIRDLQFKLEEAMKPRSLEGVVVT